MENPLSYPISGSCRNLFIRLWRPKVFSQLMWAFVWDLQHPSTPILSKWIHDIRPTVSCLSMRARRAMYCMQDLIFSGGFLIYNEWSILSSTTHFSTTAFLHSSWYIHWWRTNSNTYILLISTHPRTPWALPRQTLFNSGDFWSFPQQGLGVDELFGVHPNVHRSLLVPCIVHCPETQTDWCWMITPNWWNWREQEKR